MGQSPTNCLGKSYWCKRSIDRMSLASEPCTLYVYPLLSVVLSRSESLNRENSKIGSEAAVGERKIVRLLSV
jgi:hypothetical protein